MILNFSRILILACLGINLSKQQFLENKKCYGLALEGGGDKAAWQVGALKTLIKNDQVSYDVLTGVSAGSLNTAFMSIYTKEEEAEAVKDLEQQWLSLTSQSIYKKPNYFTEAYNIFWGRGILNNSPLKSLMEKTFDGTHVKRPTVSGVTDLTNGEYIFYDIDKVEKAPGIEAVLSSTSIPGIFPYRIDDDKVLVDGGVMYMVDIQNVFRRCQELGFSEEDTVVDVLLCNAEKKLVTFPVQKKDYSTIDILQRYYEVNQFDKSVDEVAEAMIKFPKGTFRNVMRPSSSLTGWRIPLDFNLDLTKAMIEQGENDAQSYIQNNYRLDKFVKNKLNEKYQQLENIRLVHEKHFS